MWKDKHLSFRVQYLLIVLLSVSLPLLVTNYFMIKQAEQSLLEEKQNKLFGLAKQLDLFLEKDYDSLLTPRERSASRAEKIKALDRKLSPLTDRIAALYPGVGIGYYSKELDAVVAYAPSQQLGQKVGEPIAPNHPGRGVLATGQDKLYIGQQMRGDIMNAMHVISRDGRVIGYTWANELTTDVSMQMMHMERNIYLILFIGLILASLASYRLFSHVVSFIDNLINDIEKVGKDLAYRLSEPVGVLGGIPRAINDMVRQLAESRSHKEHIISSVQDGIITLDVNGRVTEWNPAVEKITGIPAAEVLGRPYPEVYRHAPEFESLLMQTLETGIEQKATDSYFPRRDGRRVPVNSSTSLLKNGEKVMGALVVMRDLTEKQLAEEQIRRSDRLRTVGELAAGMAHEIRNPLTSIKAFAQILEDALPEHEVNNRTYHKVIIEEVERINRIVERLLLFAKPSPMRQAIVPFSSIVQETLPLVESECRRKGIRLTFDTAYEADIAVDPELIRQVLLNLLLNAVQATPAEGEIRIRVEAGEEAAALHLFNEGEPIPEEHKERIFNPFFSTKEKGVGLGLSVSQSIVRLYQGSLTFHNEPNGVTFTVTIPRTHTEKGKGEIIVEGASRHSGGGR